MRWFRPAVLGVIVAAAFVANGLKPKGRAAWRYPQFVLLGLLALAVVGALAILFAPGGDISAAVDTDGDGYDDALEAYLGTDPLDDCPDDLGDAAWPPDFNNDGTINLVDILAFAGLLGLRDGDVGFSPRHDLNWDGINGALDVSQLSPPMYLTGCAGGPYVPPAAAGNINEIAIDMDTTGNNARLPGGADIQDCGEIDSGGTNTIDIDVVLPSPGVHASDGIEVWEFLLNYDPAVVGISAEDQNYLLNQAAGSSLTSYSDSLPDSGGSWRSAPFEGGGPAGVPEPGGVQEVGPGVLTRITLTGVAQGTTALTLTKVGAMTAANGAIPIVTVSDAWVSVDEVCVAGPPPPDSDGDGVLDPSDLCEGTHASQLVDGNGCSNNQVDGDGDSVCDPGALSDGLANCTGSDNCPSTSNVGQADADGDDLGDACDPGSSSATWGVETSASVSDATPGGPQDLSIDLSLASGHAGAARVDVAIPIGAIVSSDVELPDGTNVGQTLVLETVGLIDGPCNIPFPYTFPVMDGTTDTTLTADFEGTGANLVLDDDGDGIVEAEDSNGVPTYADHYPSFLNAMLDPDGHSGPKDPIRPRARYVGHVERLNGAPPTTINLLVFTPGALGDAGTGLPAPDDALSESFGYVTRVIWNNPTAPPAPDPVTDSCTPLSTSTTTTGLTRGEFDVIDGPEPFEVDRIGQCGTLTAPDGTDNDADTVVDDGCLSIPDPCVDIDYDGDTTVSAGQGEDPAPASDDDADTVVDEGCGLLRAENPVSLTGVYGTGTHLVRGYGQGIRDADGDGIDNRLDVCPFVVDTGTDADGDGIDAACDPDDTSASAPAPASNGIDNDGDTQTDEDPVNNFDDDGDTFLDEDGECPAATAVLPDEDQDCFPNRGDNCPRLANDQSDLDAIPSAADVGPTGDGVGDACDPNPPSGESGAECNNDDDDDADTRVNDGCASGGSRPEVGAECQNADDDDGDTVTNDGCPPAGGGVAIGFYLANASVAYICIPDQDGLDDTDDDSDSDDDDDGVCDSTEDLLGSDKDDPSSTPEYKGLEYDALLADNNGDTVPDPVPGGPCTDLSEYPGGTPVDNDGDTLANGADPGCADLPDDADDDGVPGFYDSTATEDPGPNEGPCDDGINNDPVQDSAKDDKDPDCWSGIDNCPNDDNPEQQDTDGDTIGDDCENPDSDGDGHPDAREARMGTDPMDDCADHTDDPANPSDADNDADFDIGDVIILFKATASLNIVDPNDYNPRSDFDGDGDVDIGDVIIAFFGRVVSDCGKILANINTTGQGIDEVQIRLMSRVLDVVDISDSEGGSWTISITSNVITGTRTAGTCGDGCSIDVKVNARRSGVSRCHDFSSGGNLVNGSTSPCAIAATTTGLYIEWVAPKLFMRCADGPGASAGRSFLAVPASTSTELTLSGAVTFPKILCMAFPVIPTQIRCAETSNNGDWEGAVGAPHGPTNAFCPRESSCNDGIDNDADTYVDDGCAGAGLDNDADTMPDPERNECANFIDDDGDTVVNDGCPTVGVAAETACGDALDSDSDGYINDGCVASGPAEIDECAPLPATQIDDDGDTVINDGCMARYP